MRRAFGGGDACIPDLVPSDIEFGYNYCPKPLSWQIDDPAYAGIPWTVKNLLELKNARPILIEGNPFESNWVHAQNGTAILFTVRNQYGNSPRSAVQEVTMVNSRADITRRYGVSRERVTQIMGLLRLPGSVQQRLLDRSEEEPARHPERRLRTIAALRTEAARGPALELLSRTVAASDGR